MEIIRYLIETNRQRGLDMTSVTPLRKYLDDNYEKSAFDLAMNDTLPWMYHLHGRRIVLARLTRISTYDVVLAIDGHSEEEIPKTSIKLLCPASHAEAAAELIKIDPKVRAQELEPVIHAKDRHHIKNKTLFPLMEQHAVLFFTLLEGEIIRGLDIGFFALRPDRQPQRRRVGGGDAAQCSGCA